MLSKPPLFSSAVLSAITWLGAGTARADLLVVSQVKNAKAATGGAQSAAGANASAQTETVQSYYKGRKVRTEVGSRIVLYDGDSGKTYQIDPAARTYTVVASAGLPMGFLSMMSITTKATSGPTGATRAILGHTAREYSFKADVDIAMNTAAFQAGGMGGRPPTGAATPLQHMGTLHITGREWVINVPSLPNGGTGALQVGVNQAGAMVPGIKPLLDKLALIKGVPLSSEETIDVEMTPMGGLGGPAGARPSRLATMITNDAVSVRESALPESLFVIPAGYREVKRAAAFKPGRPG